MEYTRDLTGTAENQVLGLYDQCIRSGVPEKRGDLFALLEKMDLNETYFSKTAEKVAENRTGMPIMLMEIGQKQIVYSMNRELERIVVLGIYDC